MPFVYYKLSTPLFRNYSARNNKIAEASLLASSTVQGGYQHLDVTNLKVDPETNHLTESEGLILKTKVKGSGFSAIATGDSYATPLIFEINFK